MAEQKMTDEQLSQELHKRNGGRAGGTLLSLFGGIVIVCGIMNAAALKEQQEQPAVTSTQTIAIRKCSSASMNMMMNVAIPPLPGEHHGNLPGMAKKNKSAGI